MPQASYRRQTLPDNAAISEVSAAPVGVVATEKRLSSLQLGIASFFLGWLIAFVLYVPLFLLHIPVPFILIYVIGFAISFYGLSRWLGKKHDERAERAFGRRGKSTTTLTANRLVVAAIPERGPDEHVEIPLVEVRRLRLTNTLTDAPDLKNSDIGAVGIALMQPTAQRTGLVMGAHAIGTARRQKAAMSCFAVVVDYQNTSITVADGLDQLTATNVYEDLDRDIRRNLTVSG